MHVWFQFHYKNKHNNENACYQKSGFDVLRLDTETV